MPTTRQAVAGHNTRVAYDYEDDFGTTPGTPSWKVPGVDTAVTTKEGTHNVVKLFDPDSREATELIEELFEGTLSVEFVLSNPDWIPLVIAPGDGSSPEKFSGDFPTSSTWVVGDEVRDQEDVLNGVVCTDCEISCEVPGEFTVSLDFAYANQSTESSVGSVGPSDQPTPSNPPLTFSEAKYTVGGTEIEIVSNASLSISNNPDMLGDFGTNIPVDYSPKERAVDTSYTKVKQQSPGVDERNDLYGGANTVKDTDPDEDACVFEASDGTRTITFTTGPAALDTLAEEGLGDAESDVEVSPERIARRDRSAGTPAIQATASGF